MKQTAKSHEQKLNELYSDIIQDYHSAFEKFDYLLNKNRWKHTTRNNIISHYNKGKLGTLLRKYDPIAFNVSKSDFKPLLIPLPEMKITSHYLKNIKTKIK